MGYSFKLKPRASEGYDDTALQGMSSYVRAQWPASYQRTDGCFVLCRSMEYRDEILAENSVDYPRYGLEIVWIKRYEVELEVEMYVEQNKRIADFLSWSMSLWPADLISEFDQVMTVPEFLKMMLSDT